jgi:hypothetical protein
MLIASLLLTVVVLAGAYGLARRSGQYIGAGILAGIGVLLGFPCIFFPAHSLTSLLLVGAAVGCAAAKASPRRFLELSLVLATISYAIVAYGSYLHTHEQWKLREDFLPESMAERLAYERKDIAQTAASTRAETRKTRMAKAESGQKFSADAVASLEQEIEPYIAQAHMREFNLRRLHDASVTDFINSPGFGVSRRIEPRRESIELPEPEPIAQGPLEYVTPPEALPESATQPAATPKLSEGDLRQLHVRGTVDFVNAKGFGYIEDRHHVTGFQFHQFHEKPGWKEKAGATSRWQVQRIELVSLLKFDEPAVYLSDHLPRMQELRNARTRPLDDFEAQGLAALRRGQDLEVAYSSDRIRMMGPILALSQCIRCHDTHRGDLLGAFSYILKSEQ